MVKPMFNMVTHSARMSSMVQPYWPSQPCWSRPTMLGTNHVGHQPCWSSPTMLGTNQVGQVLPCWASTMVGTNHVGHVLPCWALTMLVKSYHVGHQPCWTSLTMMGTNHAAHQTILDKATHRCMRSALHWPRRGFSHVDQFGFRYCIECVKPQLKQHHLCSSKRTSAFALY
jgi:hypothetical protein